MFYLGIDIGKFSSVATLIDDVGNIVGKTLKFSNTTDGANSLLELIDSYVFFILQLLRYHLVLQLYILLLGILSWFLHIH